MLILVVVSRLRTSCLMDLKAYIDSFYKSFREDVANNQIAAMNNRSCYRSENFDFQCTCEVEQYFAFWIISML